jgi:poly(A) polymerase
MLGLPRVAGTLRAMVDAGILALSAETVRLLLGYERRVRRPDVSARLAIIIAEAGAGQLKSLWRLSNDEVAVAEAILTVAGLLRDYRLNEAAYRHPAALADGVDVAAVLADWTEAGRSAVLDQLQALAVPMFPVRGGDLIKLGMRPGKALGAELDRLEQVWIESGFALERDDLLELAKG